MARKIKAVIFDMDGLMFDTESLYIIANKKLAKDYGKKYTPEILHKMQGVPGIASLEIFKQELGIKQPATKLYEQRSRYYAKLLKTDLKVMPGLFELLRHLKQKKLKIAIATSSFNNWVSIIDKKYRIKKIFPIIVTANSITRGKPHPEIFLKTAAKLKVRPEQALVLEDSLNGVLAAKRGGFISVAVRDRHHRNSDLSKADLVVTKLNSQKLLNYINKYV